MGHHQEAHHFEIAILGQPDVLLGDVGFGDVRGDAGDLGAEAGGHVEVFLGADARQKQHGQLAALQHRRDGLQIGFVGSGRAAVLDAGAAEAVAVRDLDRVDAGVVHRRGDRGHLLGRELMGDRVHAVAERRVDDSHEFRHGRLLLRVEDVLGQLLGHADGGGGDDVEIAGILGQMIAGAFDLDHRRDEAILDQRRHAEAIAGHVGAHGLDHPLDRIADGRFVGGLLHFAVDGVAHHDRRLGRIEDDQRLALVAPCPPLQPREPWSW